MGAISKAKKAATEVAGLRAEVARLLAEIKKLKAGRSSGGNR